MKKILFILIIMVGLFTLVRAEEPLGTLHLYEGSFNCIKTVGNRAYVGSDRGLKIYDISSVTHPILIGNYLTHTKSNEIDVVDNMAYLATDSGLKIIDVSDEANTISVGSIFAVKYSDVVVQGDYAYATDDNGSVHIVDVSDATNPVEISTISDIKASGDIAVVGDYAYIPSGLDGLKIIDISNPSNPILISRFGDIVGYAIDVRVVNSKAYLSLDFFHLTVIDVSNPSTPIFFATYNVNHSVSNDIEVVGNDAYIVGNDYSSNHFLSMINVENSTSENQVRYYDIGTSFWYNNPLLKIAIVDNYTYVAKANQGLVIVKVKLQDTDKDGVADVDDTFPLDTSESVDTDHDGIGDNADNDDDNDGIEDSDELAYGLNPLDPLDAQLDTDNDGVSNIDEINAGTNPQLKPKEEYISELYLAVLHRKPYDYELSWIVTNLENFNSTLRLEFYSLLFSSEYAIDSASDVEYIETLYHALFHRNPDASGRAYWLGKLLNGTDRYVVVESFMSSSELKTITDKLGVFIDATPVELLVSRFYKQVLERNPDDAGLHDWVNKLERGKFSVADIAFGFVFSSEFIGRNLNDTEFVSILYRAFFGREADADGLNYWVARLSSGTSKEEVLNGFIDSEEFFYNFAYDYGVRVR